MEVASDKPWFARYALTLKGLADITALLNARFLVSSHYILATTHLLVFQNMTSQATKSFLK